ncbi:MAG: hypothetical protein JWN64_455 [Parcubacteria group bacterium]|nr:hypothetical protein [Parcubacteria group bacterium]
MVTRGGIAIVLLLLLIYGFHEAIPLLSGPSLSIESPEAYGATASSSVTIAGVAKRTETLTLNDGPILIDESGRFSTSLVLPAGNAILSLTATDRFGRARTERRTIFIP